MAQATQFQVIPPVGEKIKYPSLSQPREIDMRCC